MATAVPAAATAADEQDASADKSASNLKDLEETQGQTETLSNAKDRAQMTATGAMSIVQVALLREVIDSGPEGNKYYTAAVVLISLSLALQIINGMINIFIANATCYYTRYKGNMMRDISENICCCVIRKKRAAASDKFGLQYISSAKRAAKQKSPDEVAESGGLCGCCPCEISVDALEDYELEALHQYDDWVKQQTKVDLACRAAALESQYLLSYIASQTLQLLSIKDPADPQKATIQENIDEAKRKMKDYGTMLMSKRISDAQGEILKKKTSAITKKRVVQMATFWQNMMNYLFYVVFVINSFITGLVVTSSVVSGKV